MESSDELSYEFRSIIKTCYKWRAFIGFMICLYLILQGGMIMVYEDDNSLLTITQALWPTYILIFSLLILFPLFLWFKGVTILTCDNISVWLIILAISLFTCLGIGKLEHPDLSFFAVYMPPIAIIILLTVAYLFRMFTTSPCIVDIDMEDLKVEYGGEAGGDVIHDLDSGPV